MTCLTGSIHSCVDARARIQIFYQHEEKAMKTKYTVALVMLTGFGLGAVAVQGLHAQTKPPVYQITEIDVSIKTPIFATTSRKHRLRSERLVAKFRRWRPNHYDRGRAAKGARCHPKGRVSRKFRLTAILRPSRTSCRSAIGWRSSVASLSRALHNKSFASIGASEIIRRQAMVCFGLGRQWVRLRSSSRNTRRT